MISWLVLIFMQPEPPLFRDEISVKNWSTFVHCMQGPGEIAHVRSCAPHKDLPALTMCHDHQHLTCVERADFDNDADVDMLDFAVFTNASSAAIGVATDIPNIEVTIKFGRLPG